MVRKYKDIGRVGVKTPTNTNFTINVPNPIGANKLAESKKEKELFRAQRKAVEAGAHGTLEYTIKKGINKDKIADEKILKSKK